MTHLFSPEFGELKWYGNALASKYLVMAEVQQLERYGLQRSANQKTRESEMIAEFPAEGYRQRNEH